MTQPEQPIDPMDGAANREAVEKLTAQGLVGLMTPEEAQARANAMENQRSGRSRLSVEAKEALCEEINRERRDKGASARQACANASVDWYDYQNWVRSPKLRHMAYPEWLERNGGGR